MNVIERKLKEVVMKGKPETALEKKLVKTVARIWELSMRSRKLNADFDENRQTHYDCALILNRKIDSGMKDLECLYGQLLKEPAVKAAS